MAVSSDAEGNLVFYVIPMDDEMKECAAKAAFIIPREHIGDGMWHRGYIEFDFGNTRAKYAQIAPRINESQRRGPGHWIVDDIAVKKIPARLELPRFGLERPLLYRGEECELTCVLKNSGDEPLADVILSVTSDDAITISGREAKVSLGSLGPEEEVEIKWRVRALEAGPATLNLKAEGGGKTIRKALLIPIAESPERCEHETLECEGFRLKFFKGESGFSHFGVEAREELGMGLLIGELRYREGGQEKLIPLTLTKSRWADSSLELTGEDGAYRCHFSAKPGERFVDIEFSLEVKDAALRGLRFIERFNVPRGAQTWEIPLHTPDVLASAYGVEIYLEAYRLTKDRSYLEKAIYWAKTGLPFIYLWNADDQPIMLYGSIPVFGGTWFTGLWFGRLVQWCGLDYAYSLIRLAKYDSSLPWRRIAEGITISGMQQQNWTTEDDPSHKGMYPDAFDVTIGRPPYKWDLSPIKILRNLLAIVGYDEELSTVILDGVHITSATGITHAERHDGTITVELSKPLGSINFVLVTGVDEPGGVTADGNVIHRKSRNRESESWWDYMEDRRFLLIRVKHEDKVVLRIS